MLNELYQSLDPIAFTLGPFTARWYGLAYVAGFLCAIAIMHVVGKRWKTRFDFDSLCIVLLCAMIGVIVGGINRRKDLFFTDFIKVNRTRSWNNSFTF